MVHLNVPHIDIGSLYKKRRSSYLNAINLLLKMYDRVYIVARKESLLMALKIAHESGRILYYYINDVKAIIVIERK